MKKCVILFLSIFLISACATTRKNTSAQQKPAIDWRGKNIEEYIKSKGVPLSKYALSDGSTVYAFKVDCQYDSKIGEVSVMVGADNLITNISTTVKCPSYQNSIEYSLDVINHNINVLGNQISNLN